MSSCCTNGLKVILNPLFHFWKSIISRRTYSQRRQHQAARKIQQFMRQSKNKLQRERAEKERQGGPLADAHQRSLSQGDSCTCIGPNNR
ncbi:hypothetical protein TcasGA2_TC031835 [Tribolium castaneum]|uniref:Uncharacterized protein n=1 Tax=Tribolium castaneum TaxID=7070 RepID=A0A139W980_TRICA|nr:hypothetical protein TcasGA2_TC031835 [Tribolium castaneum]